jgi:hypothetical protein
MWRCAPPAAAAAAVVARAERAARAAHAPCAPHAAPAPHHRAPRRARLQALRRGTRAAHGEARAASAEGAETDAVSGDALRAALAAATAAATAAKSAADAARNAALAADDAADRAAAILARLEARAQAVPSAWSAPPVFQHLPEPSEVPERLLPRRIFIIRHGESQARAALRAGRAG